MERQNNSRKGLTNFNTIRHIAMGVLYLLVGSAIIYTKYTGFAELPFAYPLATLMLLYGAFRIWRGWADHRATR
jgi:uncharacterized membrane protein HdeD (DUF308 family)